jgi:hypothetical protein
MGTLIDTVQLTQYMCSCLAAVYNRDNKFKVAQDEEKAREKEQAEQERALNAEREYRHQLLLKRAHGGQQPQQGGAQASGSSQQQEQQAPLQHINFWHEEELNARAQHPEVEVGLRYSMAPQDIAAVDALPRRISHMHRHVQSKASICQHFEAMQGYAA